MLDFSSADMYLMWRATKDSAGNVVPDTIFVPLAYVEWGFEGNAQRKGNNWSVTSGTPSDLIAQAEVPYPEYPTWNSLVVNGINGSGHPCANPGE
jgi:hypothetical protein